MKKRLLGTLTALFFLGSMGLSAQAVLKMDKTVHNFGKFNEDTPVVCTFTFQNTGNEPLVLHQAMSSCGCTVPQFTKDPIPPEGKGEIKVTYNGKGKYPGHFKKAITIRSNASNKLVRLYVEGDMIESKK